MNAPVPQVRMDKSSDYTTVHGERMVGDPHHSVHYFQDRLPYDARGFLIPDHPDILGDENLKKRAEKLLKAASKQKRAAPGDAAVAGEEAEGDGDDKPVNLEVWARGEDDWPWQQVTNAIARKFARRVSNKRDALELLVTEKVIAPGDLSVANKKLLDAD